MLLNALKLSNIRYPCITILLIVWSGYNLKAQTNNDTTKLKPLVIQVAPSPDKILYLGIEELRKNAINNLAEALAYKSTAFVRSYGVNGISTASFRGGKGEHTKLYYNDIDLNYPTLGLTDLTLIPIRASSEMAIQFGQSGISSGTGAIGASIQFKNTYKASDSLSLHIDQQLSTLLNSTTGMKFKKRYKKLDASLFMDYSVGKNRFVFQNPSKPNKPLDTLKNSNFTSYAFGGDISYKVSKFGKIQATVWHKNNYRQIPTITAVDLYYGEEMFDKLSFINVGYNTKMSKILLRTNVGYLLSSNNYVNPQASINSNNESSSLQAVLTVGSDADNIKDKFNWEIQTRYHQEQGASANLPDKLSLNRISAYIKTTYDFNKRVKFVGSARFEQFGNRKSGLLPNIGTSIWVSKKHRIALKANYAHNLRFPTLNEQYWSPGGNINLKPELAKLGELTLTNIK